jgi:hypothetical protein
METGYRGKAIEGIYSVCSESKMLNYIILDCGKTVLQGGGLKMYKITEL